MRVSNEHWEAFLEIAESNPSLITNKCNTKTGRMKGNELWQKTAEKLNSLGYGIKSVAEWRKTVTDWKCKTKSKMSKIRNQQNKTGGGPMTENLFLTPIEERLINLMGRKSFEPDNIIELGLPVLREITNSLAIPDAPSTSVILNEDHDYCYPQNSDTVSPTTNVITTSTIISNAPTTSANSKRISRKRSAPFPASSRRNFKNNKLANELLENSKETINLLQDISKNTNRIANCFEQLIDILKNK